MAASLPLIRPRFSKAILRRCCSITALWGESDPARLRWLDAPPKSALNEARKTLQSFEAIDDNGQVTGHGKALAQLPLPPNLANMVVRAARGGQGEDAAMLALLMQERGLGGRGDDLELRLERFRTESGRRAASARRLATKIAGMAKAGSGGSLSVGAMLSLAFLERVSKRRDAKGENWLSAMGRGLRLDAESPLASADWLAVAELQGAASGARILSAAALDPLEVEELFEDRIEQKSTLTYDRGADRVEAKMHRRLGAITLVESRVAKPDPAAVADALLDAVSRIGLECLPWPKAAMALRQRAVFAGEDRLAESHLLTTLDNWLMPVLAGMSRLRDIPASALTQALENLLGWDGVQRVDKTAPPKFQSPAGTTHAIDYAAPVGPTVELRVQALFGLDRHPVVGAERIPLVFSLTSPAGRPIQTTRDLPAFWRGSWRDVAKEMRGRYPKHNWPDAPWDANASLKTKKAQARGA